jgi:hypothetical protein
VVLFDLRISDNIILPTTFEKLLVIYQLSVLLHGMKNMQFKNFCYINFCMFLAARRLLCLFKRYKKFRELQRKQNSRKTSSKKKTNWPVGECGSCLKTLNVY